MKTLKIAVGTVSEQKIGYLKNVLEEIGVKALVFPTEAKSGVSDQPTTESETEEGSINRARSAFEDVKDASFGLGIEVGYHKNKDGDFEMFCCSAIVDKSGFVQSCTSSRFLLPYFHQKILKEDKYLGKYVREYKKEISDPVINYVRELVRGRKPLVIEATRNVILGYLEIEMTAQHLIESGTLTYRKKSLGIIVDKENNFLIVKLQDYGPNDWNFSGGGIEEGETPEEAVLRELREELGTEKFKIIGKSKQIVNYEWPNFVITKRLKKEGKTYKGQSLTTFLIEFTGKKDDIKLDPAEIKTVKWIKFKDLQKYLNFKDQWRITKDVLQEIAPGRFR